MATQKKNITGILPIRDQWHPGKPVSSLVGLGALAMVNECKRLFSQHDHARIGVYVPRSCLLALEGQSSQPLVEGAVFDTPDSDIDVHSKLLAPYFPAYDPGPVTPITRDYLVAVIWTGDPQGGVGTTMKLTARERKGNAAIAMTAPLTQAPLITTATISGAKSGWQEWEFYVASDTPDWIYVKVWGLYVWSVTAEIQTGTYHYYRP